MSVEKATLTRADVTGQRTTFDDNKALKVQFNPQTLRVTYGTSGAVGTQDASAHMGKQGPTRQPTSYSSNLSVELLFDTTTESGKNVRDCTLAIAAMITKQGPKRATVVRFHWGDFVYYGSIQSMTETLDFFSDSGTPLRATVSLTMNEESLDKGDPRTGGTAGAGGGVGVGLSAGASAGVAASAGFSAGIGASASLSASVGVGAGIGTTPLTLAQAGDTLQSLTARAGAGASWKAIAAANNIDNPRQLDPGEVLDLNARASVSIK